LKNLTLLEGAFDSIARTVRNLLDLNRPGKHLLQTVDVNRVIENTLALVRGTLKKNKVRTLLLLSAQVPGIIATPRQISQVIINLVNNAVEAMTGIRHSDDWYSFDSNGREITFTTYGKDDRVVIEVADNGPGISEEDLQYIFDPFYTSKKKLGMGVGLSICHGIVEEYSGTIVAGNSPNGGAVFTIEFPIRQSRP
jgi:signal transduction histidine kinase